MTPKIHVLLVEKNPDDTRRIRELVTDVASMRFTWKRADKLSTATDLLRVQPFDLVILDLSLPDSQGLDTFIRLHPHAICLPIVILTNLDDELLALDALRAGAQDYLIKGQIDGKRLQRTLRYAIERKRNETALRERIEQLIDTRADNALLSLDSISRKFDILLKDLSEEGSPQQARLLAIQKEIADIHRRLSRSLRKSDVQHQESQRSRPGSELQNQEIVTIEEQVDYFFKAPESGAGGYVLKGAALIDLILTMERAVQLGSEIPSRFDQLSLRKESHHAEKIHLSDRERDIVRLIAEGKTNHKIAKELSISLRTVERLRSSILDKLGLQNRAELVAYAVRMGLSL